MNSDTQLKVQAYLDNELSPGEARKIAEFLSSDRDAQNLYSTLRATKKIVAANEPVATLDQSRDFYFANIQRRIELAEREPVARRLVPWWLRVFAPLAGVTALVALLLSHDSDNAVKVSNVTPDADVQVAAEHRPLHGVVEDLAPELSSVTFRSEKDGVTVVWLTSSN